MRWLAVGILTVALGCGSEERRPDTGVGANQPKPPAVTCADYCARASSCLVALCNEDTSSTRYTGLEDLVTAQCQAVCDVNLLRSMGLTDQAWACLFQSSCRAAIDYDVCDAQASYRCT